MKVLSKYIHIYNFMWSSKDFKVQISITILKIQKLNEEI